MKVVKTTVSDNELSSTIDLFSDVKLTRKQKAEVQDQVGQYLYEETQARISEEKSPVKGEPWKKTLSKDYSKRKLDEVGNKNADLQFSGRMLDQFKVIPVEEGIKIGVFGERAPAADGHNNFSGKSPLPRRRFLPAEGQEYNPQLEREVKRIIADVTAESDSAKAPTKSAVAKIETKAELYSFLSDFFDSSLSRSEVRLAVFRNPELLQLLESEDLLSLL